MVLQVRRFGAKAMSLAVEVAAAAVVVEKVETVKARDLRVQVAVRYVVAKTGIQRTLNVVLHV